MGGKGARWLASDPSKRGAEVLFLKISVFWMGLMVLVVVTNWYKRFGDLEYALLGLTVSLPFALLPLLFPSAADRHIPLLQRFWVKANVWIAIFSYVGNYFWTHYFFVVLGAAYTFPVSIKLNDVPLFLYFITHAYFCSYHTFSTILLRRFWTGRRSQSRVIRGVASVGLVFALAYVTAFMESWTIAEVPYYSHQDKFQMYTIGSAFYGIYFYVSFPMYYRLDEKSAGGKWSVGRTAVDSLGAAMLVFILLDLWRLFVGNLTGIQTGLPWLYH